MGRAWCASWGRLNSRLSRSFTSFFLLGAPWVFVTGGPRRPFYYEQSKGRKLVQVGSEVPGRPSILR